MLSDIYEDHIRPPLLNMHDLVNKHAGHAQIMTRKPISTVVFLLHTKSVLNICLPYLLQCVQMAGCGFIKQFVDSEPMLTYCQPVF